jgi:hypothetical protein
MPMTWNRLAFLVKMLLMLVLSRRLLATLTTVVASNSHTPRDSSHKFLSALVDLFPALNSLWWVKRMQLPGRKNHASSGMSLEKDLVGDPKFKMIDYLSPQSSFHAKECFVGGVHTSFHSFLATSSYLLRC